MEFAVIAGIIAITGILLPVLLRRRTPWRLTMLLPTIAVLTCGLLVFARQGSLSWRAVGLCVAVSAFFYLDMLFLWRIIVAFIPQGRWHW